MNDQQAIEQVMPAIADALNSLRISDRQIRKEVNEKFKILTEMIIGLQNAQASKRMDLTVIEGYVSKPEVARMIDMARGKYDAE